MEKMSQKRKINEELDDIAPKSYGKDAERDKKREVNTKLNGKNFDDEAGIGEIKESDLFDDGPKSDFYRLK